MFKKIILSIALMILTAGIAQADTVTFKGFLNDTGNAALVSSDLSPASFIDDNAIANNVAIYDLTIPFAGNVRFLSLGFGQGGGDPYFTLFSGTGSAATFLGSNYDQAFSTGGDFDLIFPLAAGSYTVAMGMFANMSFAENLGVGTLADGFIGLGVPEYLGTSYYELNVTYPGAAIPEPATLLLVLPGLALLWFRRR